MPAPPLMAAAQSMVHICGIDRRSFHAYTASLRVHSEVLSLAELVDRLGEPTRGHDIGDAKVPGDPRKGFQRQSFWGLDSSAPNTESLTVQIEELVEYAESKKTAFDEIRASSSIRIFCGLFAGDDHGGFDIEPELFRRIADLGLKVGFGLY